MQKASSRCHTFKPPAVEVSVNGVAVGGRTGKPDFQKISKMPVPFIFRNTAYGQIYGYVYIYTIDVMIFDSPCNYTSHSH